MNMTIQQARRLVLLRALKREEAWRCQNCQEINGNHIDKCPECQTLRSDSEREAHAAIMARKERA